MKTFFPIVVLVAVLLVLAAPMTAQDTAKGAAAPSQAAIDKALDNAMTPGEGQKKLDSMTGTFDVNVRTWADPAADPVEDTMTSVNSWQLGKRYVETKIKGTMGGEDFKGIGFYGYDNVAKEYQAAWMDNGSTGITWYTGGFDSSGTRATMKASVPNPLTGKATPLELRVTVGEDGNHVTEMWGTGLGDTMFKMMELRYTRKK